MYGNTVVLKLAYEAPLTGLHVAEAFADAELPAGVLNVLTGRGSTVGAALVHDPRVRAISFTGSVATGHWVRDEATKAGKRVQLELGGQNPLIVMDDADLPRAVEAAYAGAFWSAGQKCTATRRILVQDGVYDAFRAQLLARIERGRVGDPLDPEVEVGPIVNESQFDEIVAAIRRGRDEGGTVIAGGERADDNGYLIAADRVRGRRRTTRSSPARRCSGRSRRSIASASSTMRSRARTPSRSGSRPRSSPRASARRRASSARRRPA